MDKPRVLAIDDDKEALDVLRHLLSREGYDVVTCESAEQGLLIASSEPVDVVLSDVHLGGLGGIELCQRMVSAVCSGAAGSSKEEFKARHPAVDERRTVSD